MRIVSTVARRWTVIVACVLLGLAVGAGYSLVKPHDYAATVRLYVVSGTADLLEAYQGTMAAQNSVRSFATLATDPSVASRAIEAARVPITVDRLLADMSVSVPPQTVVMDITVRTASPDDSAKLALAVAQDLTGLVDKLEAPHAGGPGALRLQIVDPSTRGAVRDALIDPVLAGAGAIGGGVVGVLLALALQRRRGSAGDDGGPDPDPEVVGPDSPDVPAPDVPDSDVPGSDDGTAPGGDADTTDRLPAVGLNTNVPTNRHRRRRAGDR
ncbi:MULTISPECIES: YveK family protein [Gordonia]|uniref:YveK family protein n=1 Tax=Gordonia TaxID=2053 RepID=UPI0032679BEE